MKLARDTQWYSCVKTKYLRLTAIFADLRYLPYTRLKKLREISAISCQNIHEILHTLA